ncbi:hypothetical protein D9M69_610680 [compost metagenome]
MLTDKNAKGRDAVFYHYYENGEHAVSPHFGVSTHRYKLIRFSKRVENWELYDLEEDPREMHNLFGQKKYRKMATEMRKKLSDLIDKYEDKEAAAVLDRKLPAELSGFN